MRSFLFNFRTTHNLPKLLHNAPLPRKNDTMKFIKAVFSVGALLFVPSVFADNEDALRDLQIGMAGLQEASRNPAMLAQLMQDLQVRPNDRSIMYETILA